MKAIELCVNRFDVDTRAGFMDLYSKIDAEVVQEDDADLTNNGLASSVDDQLQDPPWAESPPPVSYVV